MLNQKTGQRELCYVVKVDAIEPITGRDRVEAAIIGGWKCMVPKGQFRPGSLGIYFEIDSKVDETKPEFSFTAKYHGKIKTQKFKTPDGPFFSQGLLMHPDDFGWDLCGFREDNEPWVNYIEDEKGKDLYEGDFLTERLGVTYAIEEDNKRKAKSDPNTKYKSMMARHPKLARSKFGRWCMKHEWAKRILYLFLGNKKLDKKKEFPAWVTKTDEERIQNLVHMIPDYCKEEWIATEKVDGTSTTFTLKALKNKKWDYRVCSRNVVMNLPGKEKTCYYAETEGNVYVEMANKYNMYNTLKRMFNFFNNHNDLDFVTIQAETYGAGIQKRDYNMTDHDMRVFNVILGFKDGHTERLNPINGKRVCLEFGLPYVPVIGRITLPATCDAILTMAGGVSAIDGGMREGLVFRSLDGARSFKAVDNEFLAKYHG